MKIALLLLLSLAGAAFSQGLDFSKKNQMELTKWMTSRKEPLRKFILAGELREDPIKGMIKIQGGASAASQAEAQEMNAARTVFYSRLEKNGGDLEKLVPKLIDHYWNKTIPKAQFRIERPVLILAGSRKIAVKLVLPLLLEFLKHQGAGKAKVQTTSEYIRIRYRRAESRKTEEVKIVFCDTTQALQILQKGECDISMMNRPVTVIENNKFGDSANLLLPAYVSKIGIEGFVCVTNVNFPKDNLSVEDLSKLLNGEGQHKILVSSKELVSPLSYLLYSKDRNMSVRVDSADGIYKQLSKDSKLIGLVTFDEMQNLQRKKGIKLKRLLVAVEGGEPIEPTRITIRTGAYALTQAVNLAVTNKRNLMAKKFRQFVVTQEGQNIVRKYGYIDQGDLTDSDKKFMSKQEQLFLKNADYKSIVEGAKLQPFVIRFNSGSSDVNIYSSLNADVRDNIDRMIFSVSSLMLANKKVKIVLVGHTDSDSFSGVDGNKGLGMQRCKSVAKELKSMGLDVEEISLKNSFADTLPVASNETNEGKNRNRRVQIWLKIDK